MKALRDLLDSVAPLFEKGGKFEKLYPAYEAQDTILFTPGEVTHGETHVRDGLDLKRMMITVVVALQPCFLFAMYNTGLQAALAIEVGASPLDTWQTELFYALGFQFNSADHIGNFLYGMLYFVPIWVVTLAAGGLLEVLFAIVRGHEITEGFLVSSSLIPLTLPATIPLWQVAIGTGFGIVIGKEIFGGVGMNIFNPALMVRAFLFFAYPAQISGDKVWVAADYSSAADGYSGATWLARAAVEGNSALANVSWFDAFVGLVPGSMGETSALACLMGAVILLVTGVGSWRTMGGVVAGTALMGLLFNAVGSDTNPFFEVGFHWHMVLGGWAFGMVFMATDPVSSSFTDRGKLLYGLFIGILVMLVRVVNPAYPEGMMLAILFMNMFAPFIDHFVVEANIKRRALRYAEE